MGGGSVLGNLAQRRANLQKSKRVLTGGAERGAPQAPTRAIPQPPPPPAAPAADQAPVAREQQLEQAQELLERARGRAQGQTAAPPTAPIEGVDLRPGQQDTLGGRIDQLGATERSLETQFYRLAGRMGSPRELSLFASRLELERQLGRVPTANEFRAYVASPSSLGPALGAVAERAPPQA